MNTFLIIEASNDQDLQKLRQVFELLKPNAIIASPETKNKVVPEKKSVLVMRLIVNTLTRFELKKFDVPTLFKFIRNNYPRESKDLKQTDINQVLWYYRDKPEFEFLKLRWKKVGRKVWYSRKIVKPDPDKVGPSSKNPGPYAPKGSE